jgi:hypothetical protein
MSRRRGIRRAAVALALLLTCVPAAVGGSPGTAGATAGHVPVYAYFYQWFEKSSWQRAKQDFPLAGHYSSDDPHVLRSQIAQARWAGIDGFLTSWKSTVPLDRRLRLLLRVAALTHFDVGVVYEALDFHRRPLPIATVTSDLSYLIDTFGQSMHSAFGRPIVIWTGTNSYTHAQIAAVHRLFAGRAYLLAASKGVADYEQIADVVDGEAYYWSSANPRMPSTGAKLRALAAAVHAHHGIWICPAAPGFDGRPLGHTRVIDRANGSAFATSLDVARRSSPDAIGVISWNEWSENTYIEPGLKYGRRELDVLRAFTHSRDGATRVPAHSATSGGGSGWTGLRAGGILALLTGVGIALLVSVGRRPVKPSGQDRPSDLRAASGDTVPIAGTNHGGRD